MKFTGFHVYHVKDYSTACKDKNPNCAKVPPSFYNVVFAPEKENMFIIHERLRLKANAELMHDEA